MVAKIRIYARPESIKQARRLEFYKYTRLPVTRWLKLSFNFELLEEDFCSIFIVKEVINA